MKLCALVCAAASGGAHADREAPAWKDFTLSTGVVLRCMLGGEPLGSASSLGVIVFLHGFPEGSFAWNAVFSTGILDSYSLIAPDQRGYNRSTQLPGGYAVTDLASDAEALIAEVAGRHQRVHLVAHDWGGAVAWWVAAARPDLLKSLTILNMPHPMGWIAGVRGDPAQQAASAYVLFFVNPASTAQMLASGFAGLKGVYAGEAWFPADEPAYVSSWSVPGSVDSSLDWYRQNIKPRCPLNCTAPACFNEGVWCAFDYMPSNGTVTSRTLILWGMLDTAFDNAFQLAFIPSKVTGTLNITRFANNSHWIGQEAPVAVSSSILAWIERGTAGAAAA